jgi:hypothetical protein
MRAHRQQMWRSARRVAYSSSETCNHLRIQGTTAPRMAGAAGCASSVVAQSCRCWKCERGRCNYLGTLTGTVVLRDVLSTDGQPAITTLRGRLKSMTRVGLTMDGTPLAADSSETGVGAEWKTISCLGADPRGIQHQTQSS